jgi:hypothetical protein
MTNPNTMTRLRGRAAPGMRTLGLMAAGLTAVVLCSCGSSANSTAAAAAIQGTCQQVSAVLSDGPDPDADPVGYAEAQINPLRQISTSDQTLHSAIGQLADAYQEFYNSNGASEAKEAVTVASKKVDSICPGATS